MEKIKLVIWDLDETFWKGTLSEEGIEPVQNNIDLVKELTNRGIINSIVSKNDFDQVKNKLIDLDVWDYFVFPAIEWSPKGELIKNIIEKCQLRDVNVLFLDDNHLNREEARFYNSNIHSHHPDFIHEILEHKAFSGKDDSDHSRLKQYKILEDKVTEKTKFSNNKEFLKASNIRIEFISNLKEYKERLIELIDRTNQLNYTKIRSDSFDINELINNKDYFSGIIKVVDNFGDYGIVGFYSLNKITNKLLHFVFSCRILNLGVVQYVYAKLNFPDLDIIPEVAEELDKSSPDWITEYKTDLKIKHKKRENNQKDKIKIFFKGGCDLGQMLFYLEGNNFKIYEETNYVSKDNFPIHQEHSQVLLDSLYLSSDDKKYIEDSDFIPFTDKNFYSTKVFDTNYSCFVYSVLMDYTQEIYEHKTLKIKLPFGGYSSFWTNKKDFDKIIKNYSEKKILSVNKQILDNFSNEFTHKGQISPEDFINNLKKIRKIIPVAIPIIFINGAEIEHPNISEIGSFERHKIMNKALDNFIDSCENTYILDIRKIVTDKSQLTNNVRHYTRDVYKEISLELLKLLNAYVNTDIKTKLNIVKQLISKFHILTRISSKIKRQFVK